MDLRHKYWIFYTTQGGHPIPILVIFLVLKKSKDFQPHAKKIIFLHIRVYLSIEKKRIAL